MCQFLSQVSACSTVKSILIISYNSSLMWWGECFSSLKPRNKANQSRVSYTYPYLSKENHNCTHTIAEVGLSLIRRCSWAQLCCAACHALVWGHSWSVLVWFMMLLYIFSHQQELAISECTWDGSMQWWCYQVFSSKCANTAAWFPSPLWYYESLLLLCILMNLSWHCIIIWYQCKSLSL